MSAAAVFPLEPAGRPVVFWGRMLKDLDADDGLNLAERAALATINRAIQIETRAGEITMPEIGRYSGMSERSAYRAVKGLKAKGRIVVEPGGGRAVNRYRLPYEYAKPRSGLHPVSTPDRDGMGALSPVAGDTCLDNGMSHARARTQETASDTPTTTPVPPQEPEADVVLSSEAQAIADILIEQGVVAKQAEEVAKTTPVEEARQSIAAAAEYERHNVVDNPAGLYVVAMRKRWKTRRGTRCLVHYESEPLCYACKKPFNDEGSVNGLHWACHERELELENIKPPSSLTPI